MEEKMPKQLTIAVGLVPRKPNVFEIDNYIKCLGELIPEAKFLIRFYERNEDIGVLRSNPAVVSLNPVKRQYSITANGYCIMAEVRAMEFDWIFFNIGLLRYSPEIFADFIKPLVKIKHNYL